MRLTSNLWVMSYLRRCNAEGLFAAVVRHGDDYAGAIHVVVRRSGGIVSIYGPAPTMAAITNGDDRRFACVLADTNDAAAETWLTRQRSFDNDIWVVEIDDRDGRHMLGDQLIAP